MLGAESKDAPVTWGMIQWLAPQVFFHVIFSCFPPQLVNETISPHISLTIQTVSWNTQLSHLFYFSDRT